MGHSCDSASDWVSGRQKCNGLIRSTIKFALESFEIKINPNVTIFEEETLMDEVNFSNRKIGKGSCEQKLKTFYITKET